MLFNDFYKEPGPNCKQRLGYAFPPSFHSSMKGNVCFPVSFTCWGMLVIVIILIKVTCKNWSNNGLHNFSQRCFIVLPLEILWFMTSPLKF